MSANLLRYGDIAKPLTLYNRTKSKAEAHSARLGDCIVAECVTDAVSRSDIVWSCLQDEVAVEQTFEEIYPLDIKGKLFVDSSTISPNTANSIAQRVLGAGGEFVTLPVMGEPTMAESRSLTCIASGNPEAVDRIRPYIQGVVGRSMIDLSGEEPGASLLLKLMGNFLIMTTMETVAEVNTFAECCGVGIKNMNKLMVALFPNTPHAIYNRRMLSGEYHSGMPMVEVSKAINLAEHVMDLAKASSASVKLYEVALEHLRIVKDYKGSAADISGIYGAVRLESGLPFENATV
ncbi:hypothetical protein BBP40_004938 [Aspergillus hancockii]|nr:hypothetical protein BBP40_004938 [Aspergillus hancockii]